MSNGGVPVRPFNMQLVPNYAAPLDARTVGVSDEDRPAQVYEGLIRYEIATDSFVYATKVDGVWTWNSLISLRDFDNLRAILYSTDTYQNAKSLDQRLTEYGGDWETFQQNVSNYSATANDLKTAIEQYKSVLYTSNNYTNVKTIDQRLNDIETAPTNAPIAALQTGVDELMAKLNTIQSWVYSTPVYYGEHPIDVRLADLEYKWEPLYDRQTTILNSINTANVDLASVNTRLNSLQTNVNNLTNTVSGQVTSLSTLRTNTASTLAALQSHYAALQQVADDLLLRLDNTFFPRMAFYRFMGVLEKYTLNSASGFNDNAYGPWNNMANTIGVSLFTAGSYWWRVPTAGVYEIFVMFESMSQASNQNGRSRVAVTVQDGGTYSIAADGYGFNEWNDGGYRRRQSGIVINFVYTVTNPESTSFLTKIIDLNGKVMNWSIKFIRWA